MFRKATFSRRRRNTFPAVTALDAALSSRSGANASYKRPERGLTGACSTRAAECHAGDNWEFPIGPVPHPITSACLSDSQEGVVKLFEFPLSVVIFMIAARLLAPGRRHIRKAELLHTDLGIFVEITRL